MARDEGSGSSMDAGQTGPRTGSDVNVAPDTNRKVGLIVGIVLGAVALVAIGVAFFLTK